MLGDCSSFDRLRALLNKTRWWFSAVPHSQLSSLPPLCSTPSFKTLKIFAKSRQLPRDAGVNAKSATAKIEVSRVNHETGECAIERFDSDGGEGNLNHILVGAEMAPSRDILGTASYRPVGEIIAPRWSTLFPTVFKLPAEINRATTRRFERWVTMLHFSFVRASINLLAGKFYKRSAFAVF